MTVNCNNSYSDSEHGIIEAYSNGIINHIVDGVVILDHNGRILSCNVAMEKMFGRAGKEIIGRSLREMMAMADRRSVSNGIQHLLKSDHLDSYKIDGRLNNKDAGELQVELIFKRIEMEGNQCILAIIRDINQRRQLEENIEELQYRILFEDLIMSISTKFINLHHNEIDHGINLALQQLGTFLGIEHCCIYFFSDDGKMASRTHEWCIETNNRIFLEADDRPVKDFQWSVDKIKQQELLYFSSIDKLPPEAGMEKAIYESLDIKAFVSVPLTRRDHVIGMMAIDSVKEKNWVENEIRLLRIIGEIIVNALECKRVEEQMIIDALHDPLTGLPNRAMFIDKLEFSMERKKRNPDYNFTVLFLDLDQFKIINDSLGHIVGDQLLVEISRRLKACLRPTDIVARLGGDEFTILLDNNNDLNETLVIVRRINEKLKQAIVIDGHNLITSTSIGIALCHDNYKHPDEILRDADTAMYRAKEEGKAGYQIFNINMHLQASQRLNMENDLNNALEQQQFFMLYQPIINIRTGKIYGVEALIRWQKDDKIIPPDQFIQILEENGLIVPVGEWIFRNVFQQTRDWKRTGIEPGKVSINVSGRQIITPGFSDMLINLVNEMDVNPEWFQLEITESILMKKFERAIDVLDKLRANQFLIALDDFGTGYSSLSYLLKLPIQTLKIDRSFINNVLSKEDAKAIVSSVITLGNALNLDVIAEGVESDEQKQFIQLQNCTAIQGYLYSKPLAVDELLVFLDNFHYQAEDAMQYRLDKQVRGI